MSIHEYLKSTNFIKNLIFDHDNQKNSTFYTNFSNEIQIEFLSFQIATFLQAKCMVENSTENFENYFNEGISIVQILKPKPFDTSLPMQYKAENIKDEFLQEKIQHYISEIVKSLVNETDFPKFSFTSMRLKPGSEIDSYFINSMNKPIEDEYLAIHFKENYHKAIKILFYAIIDFEMFRSILSQLKAKIVPEVRKSNNPLHEYFDLEKKRANLLFEEIKDIPIIANLI